MAVAMRRRPSPSRAPAAEPDPPASTTGPTAPRRAFRPSSRSRVRIAVGVLLSIIAISVTLLIFSTADRRVPVLQVVRDVPAGQQLSVGDLRSIEVSAEDTLAIVAAEDLPVVVGRYAKVRLVAGALLTSAALQDQPLVGPGSAVVAVTVPDGELPAGLRERSQVQLVFPPDGSAIPPPPVVGRVVGLPTTPDGVSGTISVSVELATADATTVAGQRSARIVLLDPGVDPASILDRADGSP